jgi:hypothetical protein
MHSLDLMPGIAEATKGAILLSFAYADSTLLPDGQGRGSI